MELITPFIDPTEETEPPTQYKCYYKFLAECEPTNISMPDLLDKAIFGIPGPTLQTGKIHNESNHRRFPFNDPPQFLHLPLERTTGTTYSAIANEFNDALIFHLTSFTSPHPNPKQSPRPMQLDQLEPDNLNLFHFHF